MLHLKTISRLQVACEESCLSMTLARYKAKVLTVSSKGVYSLTVRAKVILTTRDVKEAVEGYNGADG